MPSSPLSDKSHTELGEDLHMMAYFRVRSERTVAPAQRFDRLLPRTFTLRVLDVHGPRAAAGPGAAREGSARVVARREADPRCVDGPAARAGCDLPVPVEVGVRDHLLRARGSVFAVAPHRERSMAGYQELSRFVRPVRDSRDSCPAGPPEGEARRVASARGEPRFQSRPAAARCWRRDRSVPNRSAGGRAAAVPSTPGTLPATGDRASAIWPFTVARPR